jgi:hypothetical protein
MANNEGVDIIIKAQDQYTKTINNITASNELFGKSLKNTEKELAAVTKLMITMKVQGIEPTDAAMVKLKADYDRLTASLNSSEGTLKSSSKQWTSLALVVQDLPYGFRGIQNNLPALFGSIAAAAGPAYFAFSALVAIVTAFEKEISSLFTTVTAADREQKVYNASMEAGVKAYADTKLQVMQLNDQVKEAAGNKQKEKKAVDDYNDSVGTTLGKLKTFKEVQDSLINQGDKYVQFIFTLNMANAAAAKVAEESANMMIASFKDPSKFINNWDKLFSVQFNLFGNLAAAAIGTANELAKKGNENQQAAIKDAGLNAVAAEKVYKIFKDLADEQKKGLKFGSFDDSKEGQATIKQQQKVNEQVIQNSIDAKKQEIKMVEDDAYAKFKVSKELAELETSLELEKLKNAGYTPKQIAALQEGIYREFANKIVLLDEAMQIQILENRKKFTAKQKTDKEKEVKDEKDKLAKFKKAYNEELSYFDQFYKDKLNLSTGERQEQKSIYEQQSSDLQYMFDNNLITTNDYISKLGEIYKNWTKNNKAITDEATKDIISMGVGIMNALGPALDMLLEKGASIGEVLTKALEDVFKKLIKVAIAAALAVAVIALLPGGQGKIAQAGGALKMFGTLVKGGMGMGATLFANGGIISGPTMGLMGEYPGASSNPEVVAPLDKLKSLIGGGGGTLEARISGNDLLILMNKASRNNQSTF